MWQELETRSLGAVAISRIRAWWKSFDKPDPWPMELDDAVRASDAVPVCHQLVSSPSGILETAYIPAGAKWDFQLPRCGGVAFGCPFGTSPPPNKRGRALLAGIVPECTRAARPAPAGGSARQHLRGVAIT